MVETVKKGLFNNSQTGGYYFPELKMYRTIEVANRYGKGITCVKDLATDITVCNFRFSDCIASLTNLIKKDEAENPA
jgi:hypothetical protein